MAAEAEPKMLAHLTFPWFAEALCNPNLISVEWLVLLKGWLGDVVSSPKSRPLADLARPTRTFGNGSTPPVGLGYRMIRREQEGEGKEKHPLHRKGIKPYPKGLHPVAIRAVFPRSRCCVLQNPLLVSTHMAASTAASANPKASTMGAAIEHEVWCAMHWGMNAVLLRTPCCAVPKSTDPVLLCEFFITRYNEPGDGAQGNE